MTLWFCDIFSDRSKAVVPVLVLLFVALWFILRGDLLYVFPCVILFLCFSVLLVLRLPRLGKRELILVLFVRLFGLCLFRFVGFLFLLGSGKGCGLWLWHSLDFSLTFFWPQGHSCGSRWYSIKFRPVSNIRARSSSINYVEIVLSVSSTGDSSQRKEFALLGRKFFPFRVNPFLEGTWYTEKQSYHVSLLKRGSVLKGNNLLPFGANAFLFE